MIIERVKGFFSPASVKFDGGLLSLGGFVLANPFSIERLLHYSIELAMLTLLILRIYCVVRKGKDPEEGDES